MAQSNVEIALQLVDKISPDLQKLFKMINKDLDFIEKKSQKIDLIPKSQIQQSQNTFDKIKNIAKQTQQSISDTFKQPIKFQDLASDAGKLFAVGYPLKKAIGTFAEFESDMSSIAMVIPHVTDKMVKEIEANIFHLSHTIGKTVPDITHGYKGILQGLSDVPIENKINEANKLVLLVEKAAQAYGVSAESVSNAIMSMRKVTPEFQKDSGLIERFLNKMVIASHETGASFQDMVYQLENVNLAKISGFNEEQFVALSSNMVASLGVGRGSEAQVATRNIMQQLIQPLQTGQVTKDIKFALGALGMDVKQAQNMVQKDAYGFLKEFFTKIGQADKDIASKALSPFGAYTVQAASKLSTTIGGIEKTLESVSDKSRQNTELNHAYEKSINNIKNKAIQLSNAFEQFKIKFIEPLAPAMVFLIDGLKKILIGLSYILEKFPFISQAIGRVLLTTIALRAAVLSIKFTSWIMGIGQVTKTMGGLTLAINLAQISMKGLAVAFNFVMKHPILLLLTGVIMSLTWIIHKFGSTWTGVWNNIKFGISELMKLIDKLVEKLMNSKIIKTITGFFGGKEQDVKKEDMAVFPSVKDKPKKNWGDTVESWIFGNDVQRAENLKSKSDQFFNKQQQEMQIKVEVDQNGVVQGVKAKSNNKEVPTSMKQTFNKPSYNSNLVIDY